MENTIFFWVVLIVCTALSMLTVTGIKNGAKSIVLYVLMAIASIFSFVFVFYLTVPHEQFTLHNISWYLFAGAVVSTGYNLYRRANYAKFVKEFYNTTKQHIEKAEGAKLTYYWGGKPREQTAQMFIANFRQDNCFRDNRALTFWHEVYLGQRIQHFNDGCPPEYFFDKHLPNTVRKGDLVKPKFTDDLYWLTLTCWLPVVSFVVGYYILQAFNHVFGELFSIIKHNLSSDMGYLLDKEK